MRKYWFILLFALLPVFGGTYYVATDGDNGNDGSIGTPWLTWVYGFNQLTAGDTLYIRGGTYYIENSSSPDARILINDEDGTVANPIVVMNYPSETPILDGSLWDISTNFYGIYLLNCSNWILDGLRVTNINDQYHAVNDYDAWGFKITSCDSVTIKRCVADSIGGSGIDYSGGTGHLIWNCDAYNNYDDLDEGNSADGIRMLNTEPGEVNTITGCRTWNNSDDGYDCFGSEGVVIFDSCWAFLNGFFIPDYGGDEGDFLGNGTAFKLGLGVYDASVNYRKQITRCIATFNQSSAFSRNEDYNKIRTYNNTAYNNEGGHWSFGLAGTYTRDTAVIRNNISYLPGTGNHFSSSGQDTTEYNTWDAGTGVTVTTADFAALPADSANCMTVMAAVRQSDGSLPDLGDYFQLAQGSDLIDAGVDVGLDYLDDAPDLGAFEFSSPGSPPSTGYKLTGGDGKILTDGNGKILIGR